MEKSAERVLPKSRDSVILALVSVLDLLMAGFIASLLAQIGLEDVSGSDLLTKTLK